MLVINDVETLSKRYLVQSVLIIAALSAVTMGISYFAHVERLAAPLAVSASFSLAVDMADGLIWRRVAKNSAGSLPTFYTAVSGFRMLLALFTLFICYLVVGRDAMLEYCIVFMVFYFILLAHHSVFFSHVSNSHSKCDKEK